MGESVTAAYAENVHAENPNPGVALIIILLIGLFTKHQPFIKFLPYTALIFLIGGLIVSQQISKLGTRLHHLAADSRHFTQIISLSYSYSRSLRLELISLLCGLQRLDVH